MSSSTLKRDFIKTGEEKDIMVCHYISDSNNWLELVCACVKERERESRSVCEYTCVCVCVCQREKE